MRESEVEAYLVKRGKELGGGSKTLEWIGRRGAPDQFIALFGAFLVEVKAPGEKLRPEQEREHLFLRNNGVEVYVVDTIEGVDKLLDSRLPRKKVLFPKPVTPP